jgi:hypothetical protein
MTSNTASIMLYRRMSRKVSLIILSISEMNIIETGMISNTTTYRLPENHWALRAPVSAATPFPAGINASNKS